MKLIIPSILTLLLTTGCEFPLTYRQHFDPELEKQERDLMIRKDFASGEERRLIEKDIDRIQNNYIFSLPRDVFEMLPAEKENSESDKAVNDRIMKELERSSMESQKRKYDSPPNP